VIAKINDAKIEASSMEELVKLTKGIFNYARNNLSEEDLLKLNFSSVDRDAENLLKF
jgi:hypothetical protein